MVRSQKYVHAKVVMVFSNAPDKMAITLADAASASCTSLLCCQCISSISIIHGYQQGRGRQQGGGQGLGGGG